MTVEDGNGAKVSFRGNMGIAQVASDNSSSGGPTTLISGGSKGIRGTQAAETSNPGSIKVGDIEIVGPFDSSTIVAERMHGMGILARAYAQVQSLGIISKIFTNRDNQRGQTDRAAINSETAVETSEIEAAVDTAELAQ